MSVQSPCVEETFRAARELAPTEQRWNEVESQKNSITNVSRDLLAQLHPFVLNHVAAQVRLPGETAPTARNRAHTRSLGTWLVLIYVSGIWGQQRVWCRWIVLLPLRCAPSHARSVSIVWWKSLHSLGRYIRDAAAAGLAQSYCCGHRSSSSYVNTSPMILCMGRSALVSSCFIKPLSGT